MARKITGIVICTLLSIVNCPLVKSQCGAGYNQVTLNWDYLDYFAYTGNYTPANGYLSSAALVTTQNFAFGTNRLTIVTSANISGGENGTHTGDIANYTGDDVQYTPAIGNTITLTFETPVVNPNFALYDIDAKEQLTVLATNALSVNIPVNAVPQATTILTIGTTPAARTIAASNTALANNDNRGTVVITVPGTVKTITIQTNAAGTDPVFWLSDITACSSGSFPTNYFMVSKPFTGQPGYVLQAFDKSVYALDPATGLTKLLFTDASADGYINSMAYDVYKKVLYYVYSLTGPLNRGNPAIGNSKKLMKYDFNMETFSLVLNDITTIGVPITSYYGVESASAAFYNGSLFLGIETGNANDNSGRESVIWRIDFDALDKPYRPSQVYAVPTDDGNKTMLHDWSDFTINNGVLYDFDGAGITAQTDVYHYNMLTGAATNYHKPAGFTPGQPTVNWHGDVYQVTANANDGTAPYTALYNGDGTIGTRKAITSTPAYTPVIPSIGDAAEAFKPKVDYGDAPASYDPATGDPAVHEIDSTLHIGGAAGSVDKEWLARGHTALANSDNYDDGLPYVPIFCPCGNWYNPRVTVYNHTGADATLIAWFDYNANGVFDVAEAIPPITVSSSTLSQSFYLAWPYAPTPLTNGSITYLRIRITSAANGMTSANATGYFNIGEVEDYRVIVDKFPLAVKVLEFNATEVNNNLVSLDWKSTEQENFTGYHVERSVDGYNWKTIRFLPANFINSTEEKEYHLNDEQPAKGRMYYRLKLVNLNSNDEYSDIKIVLINDRVNSITIHPNPATNHAVLSININSKTAGTIQLINILGETVLSQSVKLDAGFNTITIDKINRLPNGAYTIQLVTGSDFFTKKIIINR